jgi:hypothetical protein
MKLCLSLGSIVVLSLCTYLAVLRPAHAANEGRSIVLAPGDVVQVAGAPLGCRAIVPNGAKTLDCRVAGSQAGTYGTLMTAQRVEVVRFRSSHVAKIVFVATQHGGFKTCR